MQRFELMRNRCGELELRPCDTGRLVFAKDAEGEMKRAREAVTKLTDAIRESAPEFRQSGWRLLRLARKADKAVK